MKKVLIPLSIFAFALVTACKSDVNKTLKTIEVTYTNGDVEIITMAPTFSFSITGEGCLTDGYQTVRCQVRGFKYLKGHE